MKPIRVALAALLCLCAPGVALAKTWTTVRIATEGAYPPWNSTMPSGKIVGFEPDLAAVLCAHMHVTCTFVATDFGSVIPGLQAGKYDAIMDGMSVTPKRLEAIAFSIPYAATGSSLAVMKGGPIKSLPDQGQYVNLDRDPALAKQVIADLARAVQGKTIAAQVATIQADFVRTYLKGVATLRTYATNQEADLDLKSGRVDAIFDSLGYLVPQLDKPELRGVAMVGPVFNGGLFGKGTGIGLRKSDPELKTMFDDALKAALADGTVQKLSMKWFGFNVTPR